MLASLSPARRRFTLVVAAIIVVAVVTSAYALLHRAPSVNPVAQDRLGPVLLVPGYGGSTAALEVLATGLEAAGRDVTVVELAGDGTGDLREQATVLDAAVAVALDRTGAPAVDVVGYSAGGVTTRLWIEELGGAERTRRVLTLGSPHHGTDLAALASDLTPDRCPSACRQLAPDSQLMRSLNARDETPAGPVWVSVWTADDQTVVPPDSAALDGALNVEIQVVCPELRVTHGDLPRTPTVIEMAIDLLGQQPPAEPGVEVC